jgi:hypothetical protein
MLITTSRRPCHLARVLCRELVRILPGSEYVPRGAKKIEEVASLAKQRGHDRVLLVNSILGQVGELRFLEVGDTWRWLDALVKLSGVRINRGKVKPRRPGEVKIYAADAGAAEFGRWLGKVWGIGCSDRLPESGLVVFLTSAGGLRVQFRLMPEAEEVGPVLEVASFGSLFGGRGDGPG